ncbi:hypothetical protein [Natrinema sp. 74]|uniref:hypothetical protein n=1 Tax=Natrinema sp. 74 TaxID=3384159 RepID=UPI0038D3B17A
MWPTITDEDVGKRVESADGEPLGTVVDVEAETARVEPDPELTDSITAVLDWDRGSEETVPLETDAVGEITADAVRIEAEFSAASVDPDADPDAELEPGDGQQTTDRSTTARANDSEPRVGGDSAAGPDSVPERGADADVPGTGRDPESDRPDESASITDDEYYDAVEGGARVDPDREMDESAEPATGGTASADEETERGVDVDPDEVTDPESDIRAEEDVGDRADVHGPGSATGDSGDEAEATDADDGDREESR